LLIHLGTQQESQQLRKLQPRHKPLSEQRLFSTQFTMAGLMSQWGNYPLVYGRQLRQIKLLLLLLLQHQWISG
jgi:hypothetical protein